MQSLDKKFRLEGIEVSSKGTPKVKGEADLYENARKGYEEAYECVCIEHCKIDDGSGCGSTCGSSECNAAGSYWKESDLN